MQKVGLFLVFLVVALRGMSQCEDMEVEVVGVNPTCYGFCDGAVFIDVVVANLPAEVTVMDTAGNEVYGLPGAGWNFLCEGWYFITVIDSLGCVYSDSVELIHPDQILVEYTIVPPSAPGICDGIVEIDTITGYQGDYEDIGIFWSPGGDESFIYEDMCAGNYTITVNDAFGCSGLVEFSVGSLVSLPSNERTEVSLIQQEKRLEITNLEQGAGWIEIYNLAGELILNYPLIPGTNQINMETTSGIFIYKISMNTGEVLTGKLNF